MGACDSSHVPPFNQRRRTRRTTACIVCDKHRSCRYANHSRFWTVADRLSGNLATVRSRSLPGPRCRFSCMRPLRDENGPNLNIHPDSEIARPWQSRLRALLCPLRSSQLSTGEPSSDRSTIPGSQTRFSDPGGSRYRTRKSRRRHRRRSIPGNLSPPCFNWRSSSSTIQARAADRRASLESASLMWSRIGDTCGHGGNRTRV